MEEPHNEESKEQVEDEQQQNYQSSEQIDQLIEERKQFILNICKQSKKKLDVGAQYLEDLDAINIAIYLMENPDKNYEIFHIGSNLLSGKGLETLCSVLEYHTNLKELYLGNNKFDLQSLDKLVDTLQFFPNLKILNLNNTCFENDNLLTLSLLLENDLLPNLQNLSLGSNRITDEGFFYLTRILQKIKIKTLHLGNNDIGEQALDLFIMNLAQCQSLENMFLNDIIMRNSSAKLLDFALTRNIYLKELNISNCEIDDLKLKYFTPSLMKNTTLKYLHLFNNPITDEGAYFLLTTLQNFNESLENIIFGDTQVSEQILEDIKALLKMNMKGVKRIDQQERKNCIDKIFQGDEEEYDYDDINIEEEQKLNEDLKNEENQLNKNHQDTALIPSKSQQEQDLSQGQQYLQVEQQENKIISTQTSENNNQSTDFSNKIILIKNENNQQTDSNNLDNKEQQMLDKINQEQKVLQNQQNNINQDINKENDYTLQIQQQQGEQINNFEITQDTKKEEFKIEINESELKEQSKDTNHFQVQINQKQFENAKEQNLDSINNK